MKIPPIATLFALAEPPRYRLRELCNGLNDRATTHCHSSKLSVSFTVPCDVLLIAR
jgi:hypothetical protein